MKDDSSKVIMLNEVSRIYMPVDPDESILWGERAENLATRLKWKKGLAKASSILGTDYWAIHNYVKSQNYYWTSLKINETLNDRSQIAHSLHNLAVTFETQGNIPKALEYYENALRIYEEVGDKTSILGCLANMGNVYMQQKKYDLALTYLHRSLRLCEEMGNKRNSAFMMGTIGTIYTTLENYTKALEYEQSSLKVMNVFGSKNDVAMILGNIADIYQAMGAYTQSQEYFKKAMNLFASEKTFGARGYVGRYTGFIGNLYLLLAQKKAPGFSKTNETVLDKKILLQKAVFNLEKGIEISRSVGDQDALKDFFLELSQAQELQGRYASALKSHKKYNLYKDSLNIVAKDKEMNRHELEYLFDKKKDSLDYINKLQVAELHQLEQEKKLDRLSHKNQWLYSMVAFVGLCMAGSYFIFRYRTHEMKFTNELIHEKAQKEIKETAHQRMVNDITFSALRSQMNPHFIFNALNTIQSYVYSNDKKKASNYLGRFSELIRRILENSNKETITLEKEIELLELYIDIEKARFGEKIRITLEVDPTMVTEEILIPPMLIQPYIENAIKHGLLHKTGEKLLSVSILQTNVGDIHIIVDDNGIGREKSIELNKKRIDHVSFANSANEKRIDLINKLFDKKVKLEIIDKRNIDGSAAGTKVTISIFQTQLRETSKYS